MRRDCVHNYPKSACTYPRPIATQDVCLFSHQLIGNATRVPPNAEAEGAGCHGALRKPPTNRRRRSSGFCLTTLPWCLPTLSATGFERASSLWSKVVKLMAVRNL